MEIALPMVMPDYFEKTEARILQEFAEAPPPSSILCLPSLTVCCHCDLLHVDY